MYLEGAQKNTGRKGFIEIYENRKEMRSMEENRENKTTFATWHIKLHVTRTKTKILSSIYMYVCPFPQACHAISNKKTTHL